MLPGAEGPEGGRADMPTCAILDAHLLAPLAGAALAGLLVMAGLWAWALWLRNAALVDVGWSALLGLFALAYVVTERTPLPRALLVGGAALLWSLRLTVHLVRDRVLPGVEEGRYARLRAWLGPRANRGLLVFFLAQGLLAAGLSLPFLLAARNPAPRLSALEVGGGVLFVGAFLLEAIADRQLARFKADPARRGSVLQTGLWAWSRHPNYFFEWCQWLAFGLIALPAPRGAWGLLAPGVMLLLILFVTGIPPTEAQALRSRGEAYRRYQRRTSAFLPRPPHRESP